LLLLLWHYYFQNYYPEPSSKGLPLFSKERRWANTVKQYLIRRRRKTQRSRPC
jgi:hypothetical protein